MVEPLADRRDAPSIAAAAIAAGSIGTGYAVHVQLTGTGDLDELVAAAADTVLRLLGGSVTDLRAHLRDTAAGQAATGTVSVGLTTGSATVLVRRPAASSGEPGLERIRLRGTRASLTVDAAAGSEPPSETAREMALAARRSHEENAWIRFRDGGTP